MVASSLETTSNHSAPAGIAAWLLWRPLMVICCCFIAGVAVADWLAPGPQAAAVVLLIGLAAAAGALAVRRSGVCLALLACSAALAGLGWYAARCLPPAAGISHLAPTTLEALEGTLVRSWPGGGVLRAEQVFVPGPVPVSGLVYLRARGLSAEPGQRIRLVGVKLRPWRPVTNPFQKSRSVYWKRRGVWCTARAKRWQTLSPSRPSLAALAARWRAKITERLERAMPGRNPATAARLLSAMVYGARAAQIPEDIYELFRRTGTVHVLVVSGSQVSFLVAVLLGLLRSRDRPLLPVSAAAAVAAAMVAYTALCGSEPSITRAALLAGLALVALSTGRRVDAPTAIALVAAVLVLAEPADLFAPGFLLTFAAVLGVLGAYRLFGEVRLPPLARAAWLALVGTIGAWLMTAPVLAHFFGGLAALSNIANVIVVPLSAVALVVGIAGAALALVNPLAAMPVLWPARLCIDAMLAVNRHCATLPAGFIDGVHLDAWQVLLWYGAAAAGYLLALGRPLASRLAPVAASFGLAAVLLASACLPVAPGRLQVIMADAGHGLCVLIRDARGQVVIFDAGSRDSEFYASRLARDVIEPMLAGLHARWPSAIIVSHADTDHFNAVDKLLRDGVVRALVLCPWGSGERYGEMLDEAQRRGVQLAPARRGAQLSLPSGATIFFVHPQRYYIDAPSADNNNCLVAQVCYAGRRILLTGDIETEGQAELLRAVPADWLRADVMQVPHHGARSAFLPQFYAAVRPKVAVIPCSLPWLGDSPDGRMVQFLQRLGAAVLITSRDGAAIVEVWPDGRIRVRTYLRGLVCDEAAVAAAK